MPVPKRDLMAALRTSVERPTRVRIGLPPAGIALLIFTGTKHEVSIPNPDEARPGVRPSQYKGSPDAVLIEAIGYEPDSEGHTAIARAAQACIDAGLEVSFAKPDDSRYPARVVRRKATP